MTVTVPDFLEAFNRNDIGEVLTAERAENAEFREGLKEEDSITGL